MYNRITNTIQVIFATIDSPPEPSPRSSSKMKEISFHSCKAIKRKSVLISELNRKNGKESVRSFRSKRDQRITVN